MMVVMAVVAVLVTLAFPSFLSSIRKSRRVEALDGLMQIQLAQEHYRANHPTYGTLAQLNIASATSGGHYSLSVVSPTAAGYTAQATAVAGGSQVGDKTNGVSCSTLSVNQDEPVYTPAAQEACWTR
jgi:type IV pilus assembly protein PilE